MKEDATLALAIRVDRGTYFHLYLEACSRDAAGEYGFLSWWRYSSDSKIDRFSTFRITCQLDKDAGRRGDQPYGWRVEFKAPEISTVEACTRMAGVLRQVEKGLARLEGTYGRPDSFADYAMRVAEIIGVRTWFVPNAPDSHWLTPVMAKARIINLIYDWQVCCGFKEWQA